MEEKRKNELLILALIQEGELQANEKSLAEEILAEHGEEVFSYFLYYRREMKNANGATLSHSQEASIKYKQ